MQDELEKYLPRKEIICLRGPRQAGKTTLLKVLGGKITGDQAFLNFDLVENRRVLEENPLELVKRFKKEGRLYFFLDEIQKVKDAGEKLKIIFDEIPGVKIFISGSSSLELKTNVLPALVGRLFLFELYTFDFGEFLAAKDEGLTKLYEERHLALKSFLEGRGEPLRPVFVQEFLKFWKEYVLFGGYPEVIKSEGEEEKKIILKNIFNTYLEKDIVNFFRIEETSKFEDLLKIAAFNIAQVVSPSSLPGKTGLSYRKGEEFLNILRHTYTLFLLPPFHKNLVTEIRKSPKVHFLDLGLRNMVINNFLAFENRSDGGQLLENFVFRQLLSSFPGYKLNYWRTMGKAEVDFVLSKDEEIIPVEVKLSGEKLGKSFYSFLEAYAPKRALIVTLDKFAKQKIRGTTIYWVPAFYF